MMTNESQRIGLLVPSPNTVMEPDFYHQLPQNINLYTARMYLELSTIAEKERMLDEFTMPAARELGTINPHVVVFGCTSAGALRGDEYDRKMRAEISAITKCPAVSVIQAVNEALAATGAKRVLIITPYTDELNQRIKSSIEDTGLEVINIFGLGIGKSTDIAEVSPDEIVQFTKEKIHGLNPDCLFFSCTNFQAMEAIPRLKEAFGLPIVTSNQAAFSKVISILEGITVGT